MKLVPCDKKAVCLVKNIRSDNFKLLSDFTESGAECAKVEGFPHKTASSCASSLRCAIKKYRMLTINAVVRDGNVYLIRNSLKRK